MISLSSNVSPLFFLQTTTALSKRNAYLIQSKTVSNIRQHYRPHDDDDDGKTDLSCLDFFSELQIFSSPSIFGRPKRAKDWVWGGENYRRHPKNNQRENKQTHTKKMTSPGSLWTSENWWFVWWPRYLVSLHSHIEPSPDNTHRKDWVESQTVLVINGNTLTLIASRPDRRLSLSAASVVCFNSS